MEYETPEQQQPKRIWIRFLKSVQNDYGRVYRIGSVHNVKRIEALEYIADGYAVVDEESQ